MEKNTPPRVFAFQFAEDVKRGQASGHYDRDAEMWIGGTEAAADKVTLYLEQCTGCTPGVPLPYGGNGPADNDYSPATKSDPC